MFKFGMVTMIIYTIIFNIVIASSSDMYYGTASTYNDVCFKRNLFAWLPLTSSFLIFLGVLFFGNNFKNIVSSFAYLFFCAISSVINSIHTSHHNVIIGDYMDDVTLDNERYNKEKNNEIYGTAAVIGGLYSVGKHTKKAVKDITDVDSWKEFK